MRRFGLIGFCFLILFFTLQSEQEITQFEKEVKKIKNSVSPSLVKVVAENHKKYVATGIAIDHDMILSSTIIVARPFEKIYIKTIDGKQYNAEIIGRDSQHAIIILKIKEKIMTPMPLSHVLEVGVWIALVGVFYNKFPSIFQGIVRSATDDAVILNAPVFPGASGGAVVNKKGELVAVIRGQLKIAVEPDISIIDNKGELVLHSPQLRNKNLCYALPIKKVMDISEQIRQYGHVRRSWLGIFVQESGSGKQARIFRVEKGSPAEKAGLMNDDIVISINGKTINTYSDISRIIRSYHPGNQVTVTVLRNDTTKSIQVVLGNFPDRRNIDIGNLRVTIPKTSITVPEINGSLPRAKNLTFYRKGSRKLGIDVIEITTGLAEKFNISEGHGLLISKVYEKSAALKAGFSEGDIVVSGNDSPLRTLDDIRRVLSELNAKESVKLVFYRNGKRRSVDVIPDVVRDEFVDWDEFLSRSNIFSKYIGESVHIRLSNVLNRKLIRLKMELKRLKAEGGSISEKQLERINREIALIKQQMDKNVGKELRRIKELKQRIDEETRKFREEERRIIKELERIKEGMKKGKESDSSTV